VKARDRVLAILADYGIHPHSERERMVDALVTAVRLGDGTHDSIPEWVWCPHFERAHEDKGLCVGPALGSPHQPLYTRTTESLRRTP
jgi:hypothetical protein